MLENINACCIRRLCPRRHHHVEEHYFNTLRAHAYYYYLKHMLMTPCRRAIIYFIYAYYTIRHVCYAALPLCDNVTYATAIRGASVLPHR